MHRWDRAGLERPRTAPELLARRFEAPVPLLAPLLSTGTLALVHGPRGLGKSFLALHLAWAVAAGESFLGWRAPQPRPVLYVDGEMTDAELQARLRLLPSQPDGLQLLIAHASQYPLGDLAESDGQARLRRTLMLMMEARPALVVLDNLASLTGFSAEHHDRWTRLQHFLLSMRVAGHAVLIVHHSNKRGLQRGTSRREDALDLTLGLRRPADHAPREGLRVEIHFEKARGLFGEAVAPIEARMATDPASGRLGWQWRRAEEGELERAARLLRAGLKPGQMALELGISRSKGYELRARALERGLLEGVP